MPKNMNWSRVHLERKIRAHGQEPALEYEPEPAARPWVPPIRRCKNGFRVTDYRGINYDYSNIDGALSKAHQVHASRPAKSIFRQQDNTVARWQPVVS